MDRLTQGAMGIKKKSLKVVSLKQRIRYLKLLFKWKGGVWNLLWIDFIWFLGAHILMTILYQFVIIHYDTHRKNFESFLKYLNNLRSLVPLSFLLGFFVTAVLSRWWQTALSIPWLAKPSYLLQGIVSDVQKTNDNISEEESNKREEELHKVRVSIMRYMNMSWLFAFVNISYTIRTRFSIRKLSKSRMKKMQKSIMNQKSDRITVRERMDAINNDPVIGSYYNKLILEEEIAILEKMESELDDDKTLGLDYWVPLQWGLQVVKRAYACGLIAHERFYLELVGMLNDFRGQVGTMYIYSDWKMPLVYIQVVIFVVYSFLFTEIFSQQIVDVNDPNLRSFNFQTYFPIMTILKYFLYMGWFQIGLCLMYPFAGNSVDMPLNDVLDYNIAIATAGCRTTSDIFPDFLRPSAGSPKEQLETMNKRVAVAAQQLLEEVVEGEEEKKEQPEKSDQEVALKEVA